MNCCWIVTSCLLCELAWFVVVEIQDFPFAITLLIVSELSSFEDVAVFSCPVRANANLPVIGQICLLVGLLSLPCYFHWLSVLIS